MGIPLGNHVDPGGVSPGVEHLQIRKPLSDGKGVTGGEELALWHRHVARTLCRQEHLQVGVGRVRRALFLSEKQIEHTNAQPQHTGIIPARFTPDVSNSALCLE